jgi:cystathionine gamma-synthase
VDETLLRVSVGVENWEDLKADFVAAFKALVQGDERVELETKRDVAVGGKGAKVVGGGDGAV